LPLCALGLLKHYKLFCKSEKGGEKPLILLF
jgi:hypothetical protein